MSTTLELLWLSREICDERFRVTHQCLLWALMTFKREGDGPISASLSQLSAASKMHRATVVRTIGELRSWGYLATPDRRPGDRTSQAFTLRGDWLQRATSRPPRLVAERDHTSRSVRPVLVAERDTLRKEDLSEDPTGRRSAPPAAAKVRKPTKAKPKKPTDPSIGELLSSYRAAFRDRHGRDPLTDGRAASGARALLARVGGDLEHAQRIVAAALADGLVELHAIAGQASRFVGGTAIRTRPTNPRHVVQGCEPEDLQRFLSRAAPGSNW